MSDKSPTRRELDKLAEKLDEVDLTPKQKALLSAIIEMAATVHHIQLPDDPDDTEEAPAPVPSFKEQFGTAFALGRAEFLMGIAQPADDLAVRPGSYSIKP